MTESKKPAKRHIGCGTIFLILLVGFFGLVALLFWLSLPITSTFRYASVMAGLKAQSGNFSHFPDKIPRDASNARFYCDTGGPFGDYVVEVCFELPADETEKLYQDYIVQGAKFVRLNSAGNFAPGEKVLMCSTTEVTGDPATYSPDFEYTTFGGNYGLAVNRKSHKILYWAYST